LTFIRKWRVAQQVRWIASQVWRLFIGQPIPGSVISMTSQSDSGKSDLFRGIA